MDRISHFGQLVNLGANCHAYRGAVVSRGSREASGPSRVGRCPCRARHHPARTAGVGAGGDGAGRRGNGTETGQCADRVQQRVLRAQHLPVDQQRAEPLRRQARVPATAGGCRFHRRRHSPDGLLAGGGDHLRPVARMGEGPGTGTRPGPGRPCRHLRQSGEQVRRGRSQELLRRTACRAAVPTPRRHHAVRQRGRCAHSFRLVLADEHRLRTAPRLLRRRRHQRPGQPRLSRRGRLHLHAHSSRDIADAGVAGLLDQR